MKGTVFTKTIICIFILLLIQAQVCANPIPVFHAFGALNTKRSDTHFDIRVSDVKTNNIIKEYSVNGTTIYERDVKPPYNIVKEYSVNGTTIYERDVKPPYNIVKEYSVNGTTIYERDVKPPYNIINIYQKF